MIKFRCWDKKRKKMYPVLHLHLDTTMGEGTWATVKGFDIIEHKDIHLQVQPKDAIIMQSTGRKDVNGLEVFEGDIVEYWYAYRRKNYLCTTSIIRHFSGALVLGINKTKFIDMVAVRYAMKTGTVISNIYSHPNLLNETH